MSMGFMIAAAQSGSGKTTITAGLLRMLRRRGIAMQPAKAGPDYIDPAFHAFASGVECFNLDPWAMREDYLLSLSGSAGPGECLLVEAMMGLFDGAADGTGSAADLAALLGLPVVLVVDASKQSQSVAALARGFSDFRNDVDVAGIILNRVGSDRHEAMLRAALSKAGVRVFGAIRRDVALALPSRHLGLVQARERTDLNSTLESVADIVEQQVDVEALLTLRSSAISKTSKVASLPPAGQRVAIASDDAFAFAYPHLLGGWREQGASIHLFSPLANEAPDADCDAVYLPGGYPELHAERLAMADVFLQGVRSSCERGALVYGECGGYMVLGDGLIDKEGICHKMAGLLRLTTSFREPKLHLGYRLLRPKSSLPFADTGVVLTAHEFHYSQAILEEGEPLFESEDTYTRTNYGAGLRDGNVCGSYMHIIDRREHD